VVPRRIFPTFPFRPPLGATRVRLAACVHTIFRYSCYKLFIEFPLYAAVVDVVGCCTEKKKQKNLISLTLDIAFIIQSSKNFSSMRTILTIEKC